MANGRPTAPPTSSSTAAVRSEVVQQGQARPARATQKYLEQVWAGLVSDPVALAKLQAERRPKTPAPPAGGGAAGTATTASPVQSP